MSLCMSFHLCVCLVSVSFCLCMYLCLSQYVCVLSMSVFLSVCIISVCLFLYACVRLCLSVRRLVPVCLSFLPFVCQSACFPLSVCLPVCLPSCLSICLYFGLFVCVCLFSSVCLPSCILLSMRRILKSYVTLFWSLFGLTQLSAVREGRTQPFTKTVGEYMLIVYHAMAVIVLINMLIAMMSNSFQEIEVIAVIVCYNGQSFRLSLLTNPSLTTTVDEHRNTTTPLGGAPL